MRIVGIAAVAASLLAGSAHGEDLKPFDFKGFTTGMTLESVRRDAMISSCTPGVFRGVAMTQCNVADQSGGIGGYDAIRLRVTFDEVSLIMLNSMVPRAGFEAIGAAFQTKYGPPCAVDEPTLQNGYGANFPQLVYSWCFSDGTLQLSRFATSNVKLSEIAFASKRYLARPAPAAPVNF